MKQMTPTRLEVVIGTETISPAYVGGPGRGMSIR